jgi:PhnB protein
MTQSVKPIPAGYASVVPYLIFKDAAKAIEFYKKAFGAEELKRVPGPDGKIMHAEIKVGDAVVMMTEEMAGMNMKSAESLGASPVSFCFYVEDVDAMALQAVDAGAKEVHAVKNQFYGDRMGSFADPFGYMWHIATHQEDVSREEMAKRAAAHAAKH